MTRRIRLLAVLVLPACVDVPLDALDTGQVPASPTYAEHVAPILAVACVRCHEHRAVMDGGVELDTYAGAYGSRVKSTCTAIGQDVVDAYADVLLPGDGAGDPTPCGDWEIYSMPPGASLHLTLAEQLTLARWVEQGGAQ